MKVFISWSGTRSQQIALALRDWIPFIINDAEPWVSEQDIAKGAHWPTHLARELQEAKFGIICLTPENLAEPWILFEAGALLKAIEEGRVAPYLFSLDKTDVKPPLGHFQSCNSEKEDTKKLLQSINSALKDSNGKHIAPTQLDEAFETLWPKLEQKLKAIPRLDEMKVVRRPQEEYLVEILETVRGLAREMPAAIREIKLRSAWPAPSSAGMIGTSGSRITPGTGYVTITGSPVSGGFVGTPGLVAQNVTPLPLLISIKDVLDIADSEKITVADRERIKNSREGISTVQQSEKGKDENQK